VDNHHSRNTLRAIRSSSLRVRRGHRATGIARQLRRRVGVTREKPTAVAVAVPFLGQQGVRATCSGRFPFAAVRRSNLQHAVSSKISALINEHAVSTYPSLKSCNITISAVANFV
jgi:hypothetical protein